MVSILSNNPTFALVVFELLSAGCKIKRSVSVAEGIDVTFPRNGRKYLFDFVSGKVVAVKGHRPYDGITCSWFPIDGVTVGAAALHSKENKRILGPDLERF